MLGGAWRGVVEREITIPEGGEKRRTLGTNNFRCIKCTTRSNVVRSAVSSALIRKLGQHLRAPPFSHGTSQLIRGLSSSMTHPRLFLSITGNHEAGFIYPNGQKKMPFITD